MIGVKYNKTTGEVVGYVMGWPEGVPHSDPNMAVLDVEENPNNIYNFVVVDGEMVPRTLVDFDNPGDAMVTINQSAPTKLADWSAPGPGTYTIIGVGHYMGLRVITISSLDQIKAKFLSAVDKKKFEIQNGGCATPLGVMDSTSESRLLLSGAIQMAQIALSQGAPFTENWTMFDNTSVPHDATQLIQAGMAMGMFISVSHATATALKTQIRNATTVDEVESVDIENAAWVS